MTAFDIFLIREAMWGAVYLVFVLLLRAHRLLDLSAPLFRSRGVSKMLGWVSFVFIFLLLFDEGGLFLREIGIDDPGGIFL